MAATYMTGSTAPSQLGSQFNDFLFAPVCEDGNGSFLSVLSALARLDIDPWEEAADLTRLPKETAIKRLTATIANLPGSPAAIAGAKAVAVRLIGLLPRSSRQESTPLESIAGPINSRPIVYIMMFFLLLSLADRYVGAADHPANSANPHATHGSDTSQKKPGG